MLPKLMTKSLEFQLLNGLSLQHVSAANTHCCHAFQHLFTQFMLSTYETTSHALAVLTCQSFLLHSHLFLHDHFFAVSLCLKVILNRWNNEQ